MQAGNSGGRSSFLQCSSCGLRYSPEVLRWKCSCGSPLDLAGHGFFRREDLGSRPASFWRYSEAFGWNPEEPVAELGERLTPLVTKKCGRRLYEFKLDYLLPTGSYKDRGVAVLVNQIRKHGPVSLVEDSSGNAGASMAAYAAAAGMEIEVFVPLKTSPAKIGQMELFGARTRCIDGDRAEVAAVAQSAMSDRFYAGHSWNPYFDAGVKTLAYEIAEQRSWETPDWIVVPLGGGSLVLGLLRGFKEMLDAGFVGSLPKILAVQASACAPLYQAWVHGESNVTKLSGCPRTIAEGIALPAPVRGDQVLRFLRDFMCEVIAVDEGEIRSAWRNLARVGLYVEPTSAVVLAGVEKFNALSGRINSDETVVMILTGHGLKSRLDLLAE